MRVALCNPPDAILHLADRVVYPGFQGSFPRVFIVYFHAVFILSLISLHMYISIIDKLFFRIVYFYDSKCLVF